MEDTPARTRVVGHIEAAIQEAQDQQMSVSELLGLLFFYAQAVAQDARLNAAEAANDGSASATVST